MRHLASASVVVFCPLSILVAACGGSSGSSPTTPTAVIAPPSRVTVTLDPPSDHFDLTDTLGRLSPGDSAEVLFRPVSINRVTGESFGHSVAFWLYPSPEVDVAETRQEGIALGFVWVEGDDWIVYSRLPSAPFVDSPVHVTLPLGVQQTARVARRSDGVTELFLNRRSVLTVVNPTLEFLFGQAVGATVDFSYVPLTTTLTSRHLIGPLKTGWLCGVTCLLQPLHE